MTLARFCARRAVQREARKLRAREGLYTFTSHLVALDVPARVPGALPRGTEKCESATLFAAVSKLRTLECCA